MARVIDVDHERPAQPSPEGQARPREDQLLLALLPRVQGGDPEALDRWYRREWPAVYRLCLGLLADHESAEDAAQDAMLRLADKLAGFDTARSYPAWRSTVVLNLCRDRLRRQAARARAEESAGTLARSGGLPRPEDEAQRGELREALEAALVHLTEREREAFVLRDLEGLATASAAEAMGIGAGSLRSLLTLARRRLRGLLAAHMPVGSAPGGAAGHARPNGPELA